MVEVGQIALVLAMVVAGYAVLASFLGGGRRSPELVESGRYGLYSVLPLLAVATLALIYAFVTKDFQVRYVAEHSNRAMPAAYTWVAFYAGNEGSLLFIAVVFASLSVLTIATSQLKLPMTTPYVTGILALVLTFFLGIIVFLANPLKTLPFTPTDGQGINPLLVHFGMFIHPPVQMTGLVSVAIPFSIVMGALLAGRGGRDEWVDTGRTWALFSWLVLTGGLLLGSWWAYTILGWGGYWGWDPVENSALMPWLGMTALVHSVMVQKRRGMFRMWNVVLIIVSFTLAELGMFINRGGPVPSVHSFAQSTMGWLFLFFMAFTLFGSMGMFFWRMGTLKSRSGLDAMVSRESAFLAQNVLFLAVAAITLWGTVFPVFSRVSQGTTVTVGAPFFNRVNGPLLLALMFLMGVGPLLPWHRATARNLVRALRYPLAAAVAVGVLLPVLGVRHPLAVLALALCALVAAGILHEWAVGTMARHRRGERYPVAFARLLMSNRPRYGGYVVHLAIVMLGVGAVASSFFSVQRDFNLQQGQTASLGSYSFQYVALQREAFSDRIESTAIFAASRSGSPLGTMRPRQDSYPDFRMVATRAAIRSTPVEDFYIVPSEFNEDGSAVFRVYVNPLVWWMWASGPLVLLGVLVSLWPHRQPALAALRLPGRVRPGAA